ncbi:MAG: tyrosine-protein phosphatase [Lachnospiraceae bacterium]|nr:tyrosine-protein phosphatase [Lachnospiraceae bacterium]
MKTYLHYPMKALVNCRDLGGMPTADGGVTRFGVLIRSELPTDLPEEDLAFFKELNVTTSIDLRTGDEVNTSPSDFRTCGFIDYKHIGVMSQQAAVGSEVKKSATQEKAEKQAPPKPGEASFNFERLVSMEWIPVYCKIVANSPKWVYDIFDAFIHAEGAMHFHCATGKDRTGLVSMLLLSAVGCGEDDIAANYSLSETYMRSIYEKMVKGMKGDDYEDADLVKGFFGTSQNTMRSVMNYLKENYGTIIDYLHSCGVTDEMIQATKDKLVEY